MRLALILVPYDTALRGWRSGAGPEHLLRSGLVGHLEAQGHVVVSTDVVEDEPDSRPAEIRTAFSLMRGVSVAARRARTAGLFPVVLSGNCNVGAIGLLSALTPARRSIFWFDAHGEANTPETTGSGFLDGMGLAVALGRCWRSLAASVPDFAPASAETTFMLGVRDLDPPEIRLLDEAHVTCLDVPGVIAELPHHLDRAALRETVGYLHLDLDVLDPVLCGRANSLPVPDGLSVDQVVAAIRAIRTRVELGGVTLASYAPECDQDGRVQAAAFAALSACVVERPAP